MRAHNSNGWGSFSEINVVGQRLNSLPLTIPPVSIDLSEVSNSQVQLRWSPVSEALSGGQGVQIESYMIEVSLNSGLFTPLATVSGAVLEYLHTGTMGGNNYSYRIKAVNYLG